MSKDNDFIFFKYPQKLTMLANAHPRKREMTTIFTPQRLRIGAWTSCNANQSSTGLDIKERQPYKEKKNYKTKEIQITTRKLSYFLKNKYEWLLKSGQKQCLSLMITTTITCILYSTKHHAMAQILKVDIIMHLTVKFHKTSSLNKTVTSTTWKSCKPSECRLVQHHCYQYWLRQKY